MSQESGTDFVTLLEDTEKLRMEVKTKDALLVQNEKANDIENLEWIAKSLEKQLEGVRPEFERERLQMMNNILTMKIPEDLPVCVGLYCASSCMVLCCVCVLNVGCFF